MKKFEVGIDLGTTNSVISVMHGNRPKAVLIDGKPTMPSCVMLKGGKYIVGGYAYENRYKDSVCYSVKKLMGTDTTIKLIDEETKEEVNLLPEEVSAEIIKKLVSVARDVYGHFDAITITVPAAFSQNQRSATQRAAELAGVEVLRIINEPTSAALAYGIANTEELSKDVNVAVYDLGGGTFDISVLSISNSSKEDTVDVYGIFDTVIDDESDSKVFRVLTKEGNTRLGGDDIDYYLTKMLCEGTVIKEGSSDFERMLLKCESFKKSPEFNNIEIPIDELGITLNLTSKMLRDASEIVYKQTKELFDLCLSRIKRSGVELDAIILVGGSTKSRYIVKALERDYDLPIRTDLNPDEAVGLGAAIQTSMLIGSGGNKIIDIVPDSIGVEVTQTIGNRKLSGVFKPLIPKDEPIPCKVSKTFTTTEDNQTFIYVKVFQGSARFAADNHLLGEIKMDVPAMPAGEEESTITLKVDGSGILTVFVKTTQGQVQKDLLNIYTANEVKSINKKASKWISQYKQLGLEDEILKKNLEEYAEKPTKELESEIVKELKKSRLLSGGNN